MTGTMNAIVLALFLISLAGFVLGRIMKWKRVWLASLIMFILMILAVFVVWYFMPEVWYDAIEQIKNA